MSKLLKKQSIGWMILSSLLISACGAQPSNPNSARPVSPGGNAITPTPTTQALQGQWKVDNTRFVCGSTILNADSIKISNIAGMSQFSVAGNQITMNGGTSQITSVLADQLTISSGYASDLIYYRVIGNTLAIRTRTTVMFDSFCSFKGQMGPIYAVFTH